MTDMDARNLEVAEAEHGPRGGVYAWAVTAGDLTWCGPERDTRVGRRQLDKAALLMLAADDVTRCEVTHRAEGARPRRRTYR